MPGTFTHTSATVFTVSVPTQAQLPKHSPWNADAPARQQGICFHTAIACAYCFSHCHSMCNVHCVLGTHQTVQWACQHSGPKQCSQLAYGHLENILPEEGKPQPSSTLCCMLLSTAACHDNMHTVNIHCTAVNSKTEAAKSPYLPRNNTHTVTNAHAHAHHHQAQQVVAAKTCDHVHEATP